jgi:hypothetical protein
MEQQTGSKDCKLHMTGKDVEQCEKYLGWNGHGFDIGDDVREAQLGSRSFDLRWSAGCGWLSVISAPST